MFCALRKAGFKRRAFINKRLVTDSERRSDEHKLSLHSKVLCQIEGTAEDHHFLWFLGSVKF